MPKKEASKKLKGKGIMWQITNHNYHYQIALYKELIKPYQNEHT
jgi:hypothetical protein